MIDNDRAARVLAWLLRNEDVSPEAIERAVDSSAAMIVGDPVTLVNDSQALLRCAFVYGQITVLERVS